MEKERDWNKAPRVCCQIPVSTSHRLYLWENVTEWWEWGGMGQSPGDPFSSYLDKTPGRRAWSVLWLFCLCTQ